MSKTMIILTNAYPHTEKGETFLTAELKVISKIITNIYIVPREDVDDPAFKINLPENVQVYPLVTMSKLQKLMNLLCNPAFILEIIKEILKDLKNWRYSIRYGMKAITAQNTLIKLVHEKHMSPSDLILYSYWFHFNALAVALFPLRGSKKISRAHGYDFYKNRSIQVYKKFTMSRIDKVYTASEEGTRYIRKEYGMDNVETATLGVENTFAPRKYEKNEQLRIVSCSRLISLKRVNLIIDALSQIDFSEIFWTHIGSGEEEERLKEYAEKKLRANKKIQYKFNGHLTNSEVFKCYKNDIFDVFISLSASEGGAPVSIQEALSFGIPIIATNVGGCSALVNENTGVLLNEGQDEEALVCEVLRVIRKYLTYDEVYIEQLRENCRNHWHQYFNAETVYGEFIREIMR
ncbi:MAG: glycosyltransferase [Eubacteriales bacterium]